MQTWVERAGCVAGQGCQGSAQLVSSRNYDGHSVIMQRWQQHAGAGRLQTGSGPRGRCQWRRQDNHNRQACAQVCGRRRHCVLPCNRLTYPCCSSGGQLLQLAPMGNIPGKYVCSYIVVGTSVPPFRCCFLGRVYGCFYLLISQFYGCLPGTVGSRRHLPSGSSRAA